MSVLDFSETVAKNWNFSQTLKQNMDAIGIAYDSNDVVSMKAGHPQVSVEVWREGWGAL